MRDNGRLEAVLNKEITYLPYGENFNVYHPTDDFDGKGCTGYIHKEFDDESSLADHGVRKYDKTVGRFITPDAMWEKYYAWSPYHYSANNPVSLRGS